MIYKKLKKSVLFLVISVLFSLFVTSGVGANIITIDFTGYVSGFSGLSEFENDAPINLYDSVTGSWTYDTEATLLSGGVYDDPNMNFSFNISSGALLFNYNGTNPSRTINYGIASSQYLAVSDHEKNSTIGSITSTIFASSFAGTIANRPNWEAVTGLMWSNSIGGSPLPETLNNISFHLQYDTFTADNATTGGGVYINVESARFSSGDQVPEPSTILLFSLGLLGLTGVNRRKK